MIAHQSNCLLPPVLPPAKDFLFLSSPLQSSPKTTNFSNTKSSQVQGSKAPNETSSSSGGFSVYDKGESSLKDDPDVGQFRKKILVEMRVTKRIAEIKKGDPKQTSNLSKFVFNELMKHISTLYLTHRLNETQISILADFQKCRGKLSSYPALLRDPFLKSQCLRLIQSTGFARRILVSERMSLMSKLTSLKFLERIRKLFISPFKSWKKVGTEI